METKKDIKNKSAYSKYKKTSRNSSNLKNLIRKMQECFLNDTELTDDGIENFRMSNKNRFSRFGYAIKKRKKPIHDHLVFRKNRLRHKLIRIQKELKFVKKNKKKYQQLTAREKEIIQLIAKGYNNPTIAEHLFISRHTVEKHRKNINCKLNIKSFPHLMRYVYAFDLV